MTSKQKMQWLKARMVPPAGVPDEPQAMELGFRPWMNDEGDGWHATWFCTTVELATKSGRARKRVALKLVCTMYKNRDEPLSTDLERLTGIPAVISTQHRVEWSCAPINIDDMPFSELLESLEKRLGLPEDAILGASMSSEPVDAVYRCVRKLLLAMESSEAYDIIVKERDAELDKITMAYDRKLDGVRLKAGDALIELMTSKETVE